jgi:hypothetical protein
MAKEKEEVLTTESQKRSDRLLKIYNAMQILNKELDDLGMEENYTHLIDLDELQRKHFEWAQRNFGDVPSYIPLLGAVEELGELAHYYVKGFQGIRQGADAEVDIVAESQDSVADVVIFLMDFCSRSGWNFREILVSTLEKVWQRDWRNNPKDGGVKAAQPFIEMGTDRRFFLDTNGAKVFKYDTVKRVGFKNSLWTITEILSDRDIKIKSHADPTISVVVRPEHIFRP